MELILIICAFLLSSLKLTNTTEIDYSDVEVIRPCTQCEMVHVNDFFEPSNSVFVNVTLIILKMDFVNLKQMVGNIVFMFPLAPFRHFFP